MPYVLCLAFLNWIITDVLHISDTFLINLYLILLVIKIASRKFTRASVIYMKK